MARDFRARVLTIVRGIPAGRVASYGAVASLAGKPNAARAVGNIMRTCDVTGVPCHRVIAAGGRLGGYGGREGMKAQLLVLEGLRVERGRVRDFEAASWPPARSRRSRKRSG